MNRIVLSEELRQVEKSRKRRGRSNKIQTEHRQRRRSSFMLRYRGLWLCNSCICQCVCVQCVSATALKVLVKVSATKEHKAGLFQTFFYLFTQSQNVDVTLTPKTILQYWLFFFKMPSGVALICAGWLRFHPLLLFVSWIKKAEDKRWGVHFFLLPNKQNSSYKTWYSVLVITLRLSYTFEQWYLEQYTTAAHWTVPLTIQSYLFNWLDDSDCSLPLPASELLLSSFSLCLSFSLRLAICPSPSRFVSAATGARLREVADGEFIAQCVHVHGARACSRAH